MCRILQYGLLYTANPWLIKHRATCLLFFLHLVRNLLSFFAPLQSSSQSSPNSSVPLCKKFFYLCFLLSVSNKKKICKCLKRNFICKKIISSPLLDLTFRNKISGRETFKADYKLQFVGSTPSAHKNLPSALPFFLEENAGYEDYQYAFSFNHVDHFEKWMVASWFLCWELLLPASSWLDLSGVFLKPWISWSWSLWEILAILTPLSFTEDCQNIDANLNFYSFISCSSAS